MTSANWYDLGKFRILALPLPTNPYWTTYRIHLGARFIAASLSMPSIEQCEDRLREKNLHKPAPASEWKGWSWTASRRRAGRPSKAESERALAEALEA